MYTQLKLLLNELLTHLEQECIGDWKDPNVQSWVNERDELLKKMKDEIETFLIPDWMD